jgi:hypothetical protein
MQKIPEEQAAARDLAMRFENLATAVTAYARHIKDVAQAAHDGQQPIVATLQKQLAEAVEILDE